MINWHEKTPTEAAAEKGPLQQYAAAGIRQNKRRWIDVPFPERPGIIGGEKNLRMAKSAPALLCIKLYTFRLLASS
jgi:hypothetical protein